jgi:hypothetical protein
LSSSPLEKKCTGKTLQHYASRLRNNAAALASYQVLEAVLAA